MNAINPSHIINPISKACVKLTYNTHYQTSQGAVLLAVLGILLLLLVMSNQLTESILSQHKTNSAFKSQLNAESLAEFGLNATEEAIKNMVARPTALEEMPANASSNNINTGVVWAKTLADYNLVVNLDRLSNIPIGWERQPRNWWDINANKITRNSSAGSVQTAYSIIEEHGQVVFDLGQAPAHFSPPVIILYQITAKANGGNLGVSRLRTVFAKVFM